MFTLVTFLSLFLSVGVAPAKKSPKLVSADGSFYMHLYKLDDVTENLSQMLLSCGGFGGLSPGSRVDFIYWSRGRPVMAL